VEILGVAFCGSCARKQQVYFAIGELTQGEKEGLRSEVLAEALTRIWRGRAGSREGIAAEMSQRLSAASPPVTRSRLRSLTLNQDMGASTLLH